jgi:hypothetical protein
MSDYAGRLAEERNEYAEQAAKAKEREASAWRSYHTVLSRAEELEKEVLRLHGDLRNRDANIRDMRALLTQLSVPSVSKTSGESEVSPATTGEASLLATTPAGGPEEAGSFGKCPSDARSRIPLGPRECPITGDLEDNSLMWHCPDCERAHGYEPRPNEACPVTSARSRIRCRHSAGHDGPHTWEAPCSDKAICPQCQRANGVPVKSCPEHRDKRMPPEESLDFLRKCVNANPGLGQAINDLLDAEVRAIRPETPFHPDDETMLRRWLRLLDESFEAPDMKGAGEVRYEIRALLEKGESK